MDHLFVYGTLGPEQSHSHLLQQVKGQYQKATINARLLPIGWDNGAGYPGLILSTEQNERVAGYIYSADDLSPIWDQVDAYEGEHYQRIFTTAYLENGDELTVQVYEALPLLK